MRRSSCSITDEESYYGGSKEKESQGQNGEKGKYQSRLNTKRYFRNGESSH